MAAMGEFREPIIVGVIDGDDEYQVPAEIVLPFKTTFEPGPPIDGRAVVNISADIGAGRLEIPLSALRS